MTIGTPLHKANLKQVYDAIIIGSGIGGLATASCLSQQGYSVLVWRSTTPPEASPIPTKERDMSGT